MTKNNPIQSTHYDGCWQSGPKHYECALRQYDELARLYEIQREVVLEMRGALKELMGESERMRPFHKLPDGMRCAMVRAHRALDGKKNSGKGQTTND